MIRFLIALAALLFSAPAFSQTITLGPPTTQGTVNVLDYKAPLDADWTPAFTSALATGKSVVMPEQPGGYAVSNTLTIAYPGQRLIGFGPAKSYLHVTSTFNMSATAVVAITNGATESYAGMQDVGFVFDQPSFTARSGATQYPPAVLITSSTRAYFGGTIRISGAWDGIKATGDTGGTIIGNLELGAINTGLNVDGAGDFFVINHLGCWPHGFSDASRLQAYTDGGTYCFKAGRIDGLSIVKLTTYTGHITFAVGSGGYKTFGMIDSLSLDGNNARMDGVVDHITIGHWYKSGNVAGDYALNLTGGTWGFGQYRMFNTGSGGSTPLVTVSGANATFASGMIDAGDTGYPAFRVSSGAMVLDAPVFGYGANTARTAPFIDVAGGVATVKKPRFQAIGTGSGTGIAVSNNAAHTIDAPLMGGWGVTLPSSISSGSYTFDTIFNGTPTAYFQTAGDSVMTYTNAATQFRLSGRTVAFRTSLTFNTNAFTTASGSFVISPGIAYAPAPSYAVGLLMPDIANVTFTGYSAAYMNTSGSVLIKYTQSAAAETTWGTGNVKPSTTGVVVNVSGTYPF